MQYIFLIDQTKYCITKTLNVTNANIIEHQHYLHIIFNNIHIHTATRPLTLYFDNTFFHPTH